MTQDDFLLLMDQIEREKVAPRFEEWRNHYTYKVAWGGRGAGAKTESAFSLAVQFGENPDYFGPKVNVVVTREVQNTIDLSSYEAVVKKIQQLKYRDWVIQKNVIYNRKNGSRFSFRGLSDLSAENFKGLQDVDILIVEEAAGVGYKAWNTVLPSMRKKGCEVWVLFNRDSEIDPCYDLFVLHERPNSCLLDLKPGNIDNPWFDLSELPEKRDADYARDPDEAAHIWEGLPRNQGPNSVMKRVDVLAAMKRNIENPEGQEEIGADIARFGKDTTQMVKRKGLKVIDWKSLKNQDTMAVARAIWEFAKRDNRIPIKVDSGYNPGVIDVLRKWGANVIDIGFGEKAVDKDQYANRVSEMWFTCPINEIDIPEDSELLSELTERRFKYDKADRKMVESKDDYKKRTSGKSPDKADALLLAFYQGKTTLYSEKVRKDMAALRG